MECKSQLYDAFMLRKVPPVFDILSGSFQRGTLCCNKVKGGLRKR